MKLYIPVAYGLEAALKRELTRLGYASPPAVRGRVTFSGDMRDVMRLNLRLRAGERVLIGMGEFPADTFDALFEGVYSLPWEAYLTSRAEIRIDGKSFQSKLAAVKAAGGVVKKAILTRLKDKLHTTAFDESGERAIVGVSLFSDVATITLDTTGEGLHRRGYRIKTYDAPLRETTAAAIVEDSFYQRERAFADPFCGSGTFPIEAALYARGIPAGGGRDFDFLHWKSTARSWFEEEKARAEGEIYRGEIAPIFASDVSEHAVSIARFHARRAGVEGDIRFSVADARQFSSDLSYGVMAANPPYGQRLGGDLFPLYRAFFKAFRALPDWNLYLVTGYPEAERAMGSADKRRILYNADIRCGLYTYYGKKPQKREL